MRSFAKEYTFFMKVCGVICEYNPFHRGHALHLSRARDLAGADFVVCAMSGPFVQRGEPAILDKWTRAQAALAAGADLVLELPVLFAVRAAQDFAFGGVSLLEGLGVVTHLSFGAEDADLARLQALAAPETPEDSARIRALLAQGLSHPQARAQAQGQALLPNVILGVEYLRAIRRLGSAMEPVPVARSSAHNDERLHALSSATAVRSALRRGDTDGARRALPPESADLQLCALPQPLPSLASFSSILLYLLRTTPPDALRNRFAIPEGLENRLCREAQAVPGIGGLLAAVQCRRYPAARLRRLLVQILLGLDAAALRAHPTPEYARVLGFRKRAEPLLRAISRQGTLPLLTKVADAPQSALLNLDLAAQDVWDLAAGFPGRRDFTSRLRILPS